MSEETGRWIPTVNAAVLPTANNPSAGNMHIGDLNSTSWSNISTNMANGLGVVEFDDLSATNHMSRFYRVSTP